MKDFFSIINQYKENNEVSPIYFSSSVHNYLAGVFSLLKVFTSSYYSISSGENSLSSGIIQSIISNKKVLVCYVDNFNMSKSVSCLISPKYSENLTKCVFEKHSFEGIKQDEYLEFVKFLTGEKSEFITSLGTIKKC